MAYNKAKAEKEWVEWKNNEEKQLRELGVDEDGDPFRFGVHVIKGHDDPVGPREIGFLGLEGFEAIAGSHVIFVRGFTPVVLRDFVMQGIEVQEAVMGVLIRGEV